MLEFLRDSIWTFIGAAIAVASIVVAVAIYLGQRERKRLLVESVARVPLLAVGGQGVAGLALTFQGKPVTNATIHVIKITCIGNRPILAVDFEQALEIVFDTHASILAADILQTEPAGIPAVISIGANKGVLSPHLLNPGDEVTCRLLVEHPSKFSVQGRIAGVKRIERSKSTPFLPGLIAPIGIVIVIGALFLSPSPRSSGIEDLRVEEIPYVVAMVLGGLMVVLSTAWDVLRFRMSTMQKLHRLIGREEI